MPLLLLMSLPAFAVKELKTKEELSSALKGQKKIAIKIGADWCGACKMAEKPFAQAAKTHADVKAVSINADNKKLNKLISTFGIDGLPTFIYIRKIDHKDKDYENIAQLLGVEDKATIVMTRKDVGFRDEDAFSNAFDALSGTTKKKEEVTTAPAPKKKAKPKPKKRTERTRRGSRRKPRHEEAQEWAEEHGIPTADDSYNGQ
jgi:thiol-disulfide isomerase/thioredoxin